MTIEAVIVLKLLRPDNKSENSVIVPINPSNALYYYKQALIGYFQAGKRYPEKYQELVEKLQHVAGKLDWFPKQRI